MRFTTCPPEQKQTLRTRAKYWIPPGLLPHKPQSCHTHTLLCRLSPKAWLGTSTCIILQTPQPSKQGNKALQQLKQKCSGTFLLALNVNRSTTEQQDVAQTAENNQPAQLTRFCLVQMSVCSLPRPRPSLLSCSSFVQNDNGAHGMLWLCMACLLLAFPLSVFHHQTAPPISPG